MKHTVSLFCFVNMTKMGEGIRWHSQGAPDSGPQRQESSSCHEAAFE